MKALALPLARPIATFAVYAGILLLGAAALQELPLSLAPDVERPLLQVQLRWPNASPEAMEALVTSPVEAECERLAHVHEVSSVSARGWASVEVQYDRGTAMDRAEVFLRERLGALRDALPPDVEPPEIEMASANELDREVFLFVRAGGPYTAEALRDLLEDRVLPRLLSVPGVAGGRVFGGGQTELRVDLSPDAYGRGLADPGAVVAAMSRLGALSSLGAVREGGERLPVLLRGDEALSGNLAASAIDRDGTRERRVSDVARVIDGSAEPTRIARVNGKPAVGLVLEREPGTNLLRVAAAARGALADLSSQLDDRISLDILYDQSERIREELASLGRRMAVSVLGIFILLALAERRVRAPVVVLASVLFATLITFLLFRVAGLGMNLVTLSGLALAFGLAVDSSIVLLQNIALRLRGGSDPLRTLAATREVLLPLFAGTLTTAVVMIPFLHLSGDLRAYYLPFVASICLSLLASLVVALSLTPLLSRWAMARVERSSSRRGPTFWARLAGWPRRSTPPVRDLYLRALSPTLRRPWLAPAAAVLLFIGSIWIFRTQVTRGSLWPSAGETQLAVSATLPEGAETERTDALLARFERRALESPFFAKGYIEQVELLVQRNRGSLSVRFAPAVALTTVPAALQEEMQVLAAALAGAEIDVSGTGPGFSSSRAQVTPAYQLTLRGPDYRRLAEVAEDLGRRLEREPRVREIDTNASGIFADDASELWLSPDREALARAGLSMAQLVSWVQPAVAGDLAQVQLRGPRGDLPARLRLGDGDALEAPALLATPIPTSAGVTTTLDHFLSVQERAAPSEIRRARQEYTRQISFDYRGPAAVGNRFVRAFVENSAVPAGYTLEEGLGLFLTPREERDLRLALVLALLLVYMVSAALFESFRWPFVALAAVPLAFTGVAVLFWASGETFDRTAYVGLILLVGVAINHSLLWVHRAAWLFRRHRDATLAALTAARERFRPIVLTSLTSATGLLPLALGRDSGAADSWRALALSATAGLLSSAAITLTVIPSLFVLFTRTRTPRN